MSAFSCVLCFFGNLLHYNFNKFQICSLLVHSEMFICVEAKGPVWPESRNIRLWELLTLLWATMSCGACISATAGFTTTCFESESRLFFSWQMKEQLWTNQTVLTIMEQATSSAGNHVNPQNVKISDLKFVLPEEIYWLESF